MEILRGGEGEGVANKCNLLPRRREYCEKLKHKKTVFSFLGNKLIFISGEQGNRYPPIPMGGLYIVNYWKGTHNL